MEDFDFSQFYRLSTMFRGEDHVLDVINEGSLQNLMRLNSRNDSSSQFWKISETEQEGFFRLSPMNTVVPNHDKSLDIFNGGDFNNMPHLTQSANLSGQFWTISRSNREGFFKLGTMFNGTEMSLDIFNGGDFNNMPHLTQSANFSGQFWKISGTGVRLEDGGITVPNVPLLIRDGATVEVIGSGFLIASGRRHEASSALLAGISVGDIVDIILTRTPNGEESVQRIRLVDTSIVIPNAPILVRDGVIVEEVGSNFIVANGQRYDDQSGNLLKGINVGDRVDVTLLSMPDGTFELTNIVKLS